jgi:hypothetical protein
MSSSRDHAQTTTSGKGTLTLAAPDIEYDAGDSPLFGAFFACDRCDGQGVVPTGETFGNGWDAPREPVESKCPDCEGFGTVYVEEGC